MINLNNIEIKNNNVKEQEIKNKIKELVKEEDCDILKEKLQELAKRVDTYVIFKVNRKTYLDFYEVTGYTNRSEDIGPKIGKLSKELYDANKDQIEKLRIAGDKDQLKKLINKLNKELINKK